jgi:hypothetical protein
LPVVRLLQSPERSRARGFFVPTLGQSGFHIGVESVLIERETRVERTCAARARLVNDGRTIFSEAWTR